MRSTDLKNRENIKDTKKLILKKLGIVLEQENIKDTRLNAKINDKNNVSEAQSL